MIDKKGVDDVIDIIHSDAFYKPAHQFIYDAIFKLFENSDPRHKVLMHTVDKLNKIIGQHKVKLGSQDLERTWKMRQEKLSPRYTTQLSEIIKVKA